MTLLGQRIDYLADMRRRGLIGIPEDESSYRTFWRWQKVVPVLALALVIAVTIRRPLDAFLAAVEDTAIVAPHH